MQVLRQAGHTQVEVAEQLAISERAVRRIEQEPPVAVFDDAAERARRGIGRPSKVDAYRERIAALLAGEPSMQGLEVLRRLREDGYKGGKSAVYDVVAARRPRDAQPMVRFESVACAVAPQRAGARSGGRGLDGRGGGHSRRRGAV